VRRWRLTLEYDGSGFVGWQRQAQGMSVQQALEEAAARLEEGRLPESVAAGRTDAGVHATGQVVHLDLGRAIEARSLLPALNFHLRPHPVAVVAADMVTETFHARFDAVGRSYRYRILNRAAPPVLERGRVWHVHEALDLASMEEGARALLGRHDFTSFRATACQAKSPVRTLDRLSVWRGGDEVVIEAEARSFLHHQVRNMVGSLVLVGQGRRPPGWIGDALQARDRAASGPTAPAHGLVLVDVRYQEGWGRELPQTPTFF